MADGNFALDAQRRGLWILAGRKRAGDAGGQPGRHAGAAADHHGIGARLRQGNLGADRVDDIAIDDDGNLDRRLDGSHQRDQSALPLKNWQRVRACTLD